MFFTLSKVLWFLAQPSSLLALAILAGLLMQGTRRAGAGRQLGLAGLAGLAVLGLSSIGDALVLPLEQRFPRPDLSAPGTRIDGIVILGGAEDGAVASARGAMAVNEAAERFTEAVALKRRFPMARVVFTGGSAALIGGGEAADAGTVGRMLQDLGVPAADIVLEIRSRNTHENAVFTRALVIPKAGERWLLVTSAYHMPRAMGVFRKAGLAVEPWPVDYRTTGQIDWLGIFGSLPDGLKRVDLAAKEYLGLVAYRLSGRTDALFPAP